MRTSSSVAVAVALLVTTALIGGVAGVAAGAGSSIHTDGSVQADGSIQSDDSASACEFPLTITDATGEEITLEEPPERITTTNPSAAQIMWEFDAQDRVVGVTQFAGYLDGAGERTNVSAETGVDIEKIVGTDPDLVLAPNASAEAVEPLRDAGVTVYHFHEATDVDDIADKTETVGTLVDECGAAAEVNEWMYDEVDAVEDRTADGDRPAALYPLGSGFVAAGNTFIDEIMTIGGVDNVAAAEHEGYPQLSDEVILSTDPELILVVERTADILEEQPYASTTAGQEGNAVVMQVHYLNQPAPRSVVESANTLADAVEEYNAGVEGADGDASVNDGDDASTDGEDGTSTDGTDDATESDAETPVEANDGDDTTGGEAPGFGAVAGTVAALIASLAAVLTARRR